MRFKRRKFIVFLILFLGVTLLSAQSFSYPDEEKAYLTLSGITSQATQMVLSSNYRYLYVTFNDKIKTIDMATFGVAASSAQPYDISADTDYDRVVGGLALSSTRLYASQKEGYLLSFDLNNITAEPSHKQIVENHDLGLMAINSAHSRLYILDTTAKALLVYDIGTGETTTIALTYTSTFVIKNLILAKEISGGADYIYVLTDIGVVFEVIDGSTSVSTNIVNSDGDSLVSACPKGDNGYMYFVDYDDSSIIATNPTNLSVAKTVVLLLKTSTSTYNTELAGIVSSTFNNATSVYTYISGLKGVSVLNSSEQLLNVDTSGSYDYNPIAVTGECKGPLITSSDRYVYMSCAGGNISVITDKPFVTISSVVYSSGGSSMGVGESVAITFQSDEAGTYTARAGGSIDASGTILKDASNNNITGAVAAATDTVITVPYDNNSSVLSEGDNTVFIFVTSTANSLQGRDATTVKVDTPPPQVTVTSTGFGNTRMYVYITRLNISDIYYYNVYVSTNTNDVDNRLVTPHRIYQTSSGSTVTAEISGLVNDTLYYGSVEAVDNAGNVGTLQSYLSDGVTRISATPRETGGPAELMGEKGCSINQGGGENPLKNSWFILLVILLVVIKFSSRFPRFFIVALLAVFIFLLFPTNLHAAESSPEWWTTEIKGGFWMPTNKTMKRFFQPCCHLTGMVEQGFLYKSKYGVGLGIGFLSENAAARVVASPTTVSQDRFNLFLLPMETNLVFRADFMEDQVIVPYVKAGVDYVFFRENLRGHVIQGMKYGMHALGGFGILLDNIDQGTKYSMEEEMGINDLYFLLEARYNWINSFNTGGLDLSSLIFSFGLLFTY